MSKTAMIRARVGPSLKKEVERILRDLGLSVTEAVTIFYHQIKLQKGLPFDVRIPNQRTLKAMEDVNGKRGLTHAANVKDMLKKLED